jgi:hypothetical protein
MREFVRDQEKIRTTEWETCLPTQKGSGTQIRPLLPVRVTPSLVGTLVDTVSTYLGLSVVGSPASDLATR